MHLIIYLKLYLMLLFLSLATSIDSYAQKIDIMSMNVNSSITVAQNIKDRFWGSVMYDDVYFEFVTSSPAIVFNISLINDTTDILTIATKKAHSYLRYEFNGKKYTINSLGIFSENPFPGELINIRPQKTLEFQLLFGLFPEYAFSVENYAKNIWQIIPTLQIELELHRPKGMTVVSEPLNWKSITISGE